MSMHEAMCSQNASQQELFQSICQQFGSAKVVGLLVACFDEQQTGQVLEKLEVSGPMPGATLVAIYNNNRNLGLKENNYE